jgi:hypothetical protein
MAKGRGDWKQYAWGMNVASYPLFCNVTNISFPQLSMLFKLYSDLDLGKIMGFFLVWNGRVLEILFFVQKNR